MPEKSGRDAAPCAARLAGPATGATCCAEAEVAAAANAATNSKCHCTFMSTSPSWLPSSRCGRSRYLIAKVGTVHDRAEGREGCLNAEFGCLCEGREGEPRGQWRFLRFGSAICLMTSCSSGVNTRKAAGEHSRPQYFDKRNSPVFSGTYGPLGLARQGRPSRHDQHRRGRDAPTSA